MSFFHGACFATLLLWFFIIPFFFGRLILLMPLAVCRLRETREGNLLHDQPA